MTRPLISGLLPVLISTLVSFPRVCAQEQGQPSQQTGDQDVIRVNTTLLTLPVRVIDRHGKLVPDLKQEQFHVYEDGVEQDIAYFEPPWLAGNATTGTNTKPFTLALLLDISDSTESKLEQIKQAALSFLDLLSPADQVMVVVFDSRVQFLTQATTDRDVLRAAINRSRTGGGTSLYGALDAVVRDRFRRIAGRKAIVLLTDGVDTSSKGPTAESSLRAVQESDAAVYPVQYFTYGDFAGNSSRETYGAGEFGAVAHKTRNGESASEAYKRATLYLRLLADKTGGHFQYADSTRNLARSFELIAAELRQQYTIGYYPKNKTDVGGQRIIKVEVAAPQVTVHTRKNYVYQPTKN